MMKIKFFCIVFTVVTLFTSLESFSSQGAIPGEKTKEHVKIPCPGEKTIAGLSTVYCSQYVAVDYDELDNLPSSFTGAQKVCCDKAREKLMKAPYVCDTAEFEDNYTQTTITCDFPRDPEYIGCVIDEDLLNAIIGEHEESIKCLPNGDQWVTGCYVRRAKYLDLAPGSILTCNKGPFKDL